MLRKLSPATLGDAAFAGDEAKLKRVLAAGASPNEAAQCRDDGFTEPELRYTPLMDAAWRGNSPCLDLLVAAGADISATTATGETALHLAAQWGQWDTTQRLIRHGAPLDARTTIGETPLIFAAQFNQTLCSRKLVLAGADATIATPEGATAADVAERAGFTETARLLRNLPPMVAQVRAQNASSGLSHLSQALFSHFSVAFPSRSGHLAQVADTTSGIPGRPNGVRAGNFAIGTYYTIAEYGTDFTAIGAPDSRCDLCATCRPISVNLRPTSGPKAAFLLHIWPQKCSVVAGSGRSFRRPGKAQAREPPIGSAT